MKISSTSGGIGTGLRLISSMITLNTTSSFRSSPVRSSREKLLVGTGSQASKIERVLYRVVVMSPIVEGRMDGVSGCQGEDKEALGEGGGEGWGEGL